MSETAEHNTEHCLACVYYPPNLPSEAYRKEDYAMLTAKHCSFDYSPGDSGCLNSRKSSCSLIDLTG